MSNRKNPTHTCKVNTAKVAIEVDRLTLVLCQAIDSLTTTTGNRATAKAEYATGAVQQMGDYQTDGRRWQLSSVTMREGRAYSVVVNCTLSGGGGAVDNGGYIAIMATLTDTATGTAYHMTNREPLELPCGCSVKQRGLVLRATVASVRGAIVAAILDTATAPIGRATDDRVTERNMKADRHMTKGDYAAKGRKRFKVGKAVETFCKVTTA